HLLKTEQSVFERLLKVNADKSMKEDRTTLREKILDTAIALFIEKGSENVTTRELTEALNLSRSHIYHYFSDWQTLCLDAYSRFMLTDLDNFTQTVQAAPPEQQLRAFITGYLPETTDAIWQLYSALWRKAIREARYAELALAMTHAWDRLLSDIIAANVTKDIDVMQVTRQLSALLNGYADHLMINPTPEARRQAMNDIDAFLQRSL
ncbi:TetR/AcrR family transcriptional regulator, partial [Candidatus Symbiopectobacterium sp. NZEC135]|uniref:TetR/AcrR family transcriptional regulator n=2 Tax=Symbiopectobacterium TaxID=801 RepID=UPI0029CABA81